MTEQEIFDVFLDELLQRAVDVFLATAQYALLAEKLERMHRDCDSMFAADEKEFAEECFSLLLDVSGHQERHLYQKGLRDGVTILKRLGVFAT